MRVATSPHHFTKYMVRNAKTLADGSMRVSNFVRIFRPIHRADYRCHMGNFYRYHTGARFLRDENMYYAYRFAEIMQGFDGTFVALPRKKVEYEWGVSQKRCAVWKYASSLYVWFRRLFLKREDPPAMGGSATRRTGVQKSPTKFVMRSEIPMAIPLRYGRILPRAPNAAAAEPAYPIRGRLYCRRDWPLYRGSFRTRDRSIILSTIPPGDYHRRLP